MSTIINMFLSITSHGREAKATLAKFRNDPVVARALRVGGIVALLALVASTLAVVWYLGGVDFIFGLLELAFWIVVIPMGWLFCFAVVINLVSIEAAQSLSDLEKWARAHKANAK